MAKKTILVCGYGPGVSSAIAEKFGAAGFAVALVARNQERLDAGVKALAAKGITAAAFTADLGDPKAAASLPARVRAALGPVAVIHWTAYGNGAGDLLDADPAAIHAQLDVAVSSLLATVKAALPDLRESEKPAVLVTNGGFGKLAQPIDAAAVKFSSMGLALANAAKNKLVGLLSERLRGDGVYVGQVMINGTVRGSAWDRGQNPTTEPSAIAELFWKLYTDRSEIRAEI